MKYLSFSPLTFAPLILVALVTTARAEPFPCPEAVAKRTDLQKSVAFLQSIAGTYKLGGCQIEVHVCDPSAPQKVSLNTLAADVLVTDYKGFQRYIPVYFVNANTTRTKVRPRNFRRTFNYVFKDKIPDPVNGRYERHEVEIVKTQNLSGVEYMEFGFHTETERKKRVGKSWIICGGINDDALVAKRGYEIREH